MDFEVQSIMESNKHIESLKELEEMGLKSQRMLAGKEVTMDSLNFYLYGSVGYELDFFGESLLLFRLEEESDGEFRQRILRSLF